MRIKSANTIRTCVYCTYDNYKCINLTYSNGDSVTAKFGDAITAGRMFMQMLHNGYLDLDSIDEVDLEAVPA